MTEAGGAGARVLVFLLRCGSSEWIMCRVRHYTPPPPAAVESWIPKCRRRLCRRCRRTDEKYSHSAKKMLVSGGYFRVVNVIVSSAHLYMLRLCTRGVRMHERFKNMSSRGTLVCSSE